MMSRRKLHACGIIIDALSCVPAFAANSWSQFRDPDGAFTVDFPAPPTVKNLNDRRNQSSNMSLMAGLPWVSS